MNQNFLGKYCINLLILFKETSIEKRELFHNYAVTVVVDLQTEGVYMIE